MTTLTPEQRKKRFSIAVLVGVLFVVAMLAMAVVAVQKNLAEEKQNRQGAWSWSSSEGYMHTIVFVIQPTPEIPYMMMHVSAWGENAEQIYDYSVGGQWAYPTTQVFSMPERTVNFTIAFIPTNKGTVTSVDCHIKVTLVGGGVEEYDQHDDYDDITLPQCDWIRGRGSPAEG